MTRREIDAIVERNARRWSFEEDRESLRRIRHRQEVRASVRSTRRAFEELEVAARLMAAAFRAASVDVGRFGVMLARRRRRC